MSQHVPPSTTEGAEPQAPQESAATLVTAPPPRCLVAVGALILALVLLPPWVAWVCRAWGLQAMRIGASLGMVGGLLAAILGVVGVVRTVRRRRRGRGLAIAAIVLGIVGGVLQLVVGTTLSLVATIRLAGVDAMGLLSLPRADIHENAGRWYEMVASSDFREAVTQGEFEIWVDTTLSTWGQLQDHEALSRLSRTPTGGIVARFRGRFVKGTRPIEVVLVGVGQPRPRIDNIRVGDSSPRP